MSHARPTLVKVMQGCLLVAIAAGGLTGVSQAHAGGGGHGGGWHGGGWHGGARVGVWVGPVGWPGYYGYPYPYAYAYPYGYAYPYPYPYPYPYAAGAYPSAPYAAPPAAAQAPQPAPQWYYCPDSQMFYPHVSECPSGWQAVPATPPATKH